jgi:hypothetical protein
MTVQQHHRLPLTAVPHPERHLADIDTVQLEAIKHEPHLPTRSSANQARKSHPVRRRGLRDPLTDMATGLMPRSDARAGPRSQPARRVVPGGITICTRWVTLPEHTENDG